MTPSYTLSSLESKRIIRNDSVKKTENSIEYSLGPTSLMPKKRASVKHAETRLALERSFERKAGDFEFEAGIAIQVRGAEVYIVHKDPLRRLCVVDDADHFWHIVWRAMCQQFPALSQYVQ
jgi:hypothetical protein